MNKFVCRIATVSGVQEVDIRGWSDLYHVDTHADTEAIVLNAKLYGTATKATQA